MVQIVFPDTLYTAVAWGASRKAIHAFYRVAVRDSLSLRSLRSSGRLRLKAPGRSSNNAETSAEVLRPESVKRFGSK